MTWLEVCEHPGLQNLPFKIELNENGEIVMNAVRVIHSIYQGEIEFLLRSFLKTGKTLPECAVKTRRGTKVADVAWASKERIKIVKNDVECSIAPEICVEVVSISNTGEEMNEKVRLYLDAGAQEVWICNDGNMIFYNIHGVIKKSLLVPNFPNKIEV